MTTELALKPGSKKVKEGQKNESDVHWVDKYGTGDRV
jgi:hypothetical protein